MNELKKIGERLALDLIRYEELGGDMENLTAGNVYSLLNGKEPLDDLTYSCKIEKELINFTPEQFDLISNKLNLDVKEKLRPSLYEFLYRIVESDINDFNKLSTNKKIQFLKEGYKFIEVSRPKSRKNNIEIIQ